MPVSTPRLTSRPFRPAITPQPISAGISGTKMSATRRSSSLRGVALRRVRSAFSSAPRSARRSAVGVSSASNSGVTRATVPGPSTIW